MISDFMIFLAVAPGIALMIIVYLNDRVEKEPVRNILRYMAFGALMVLPAGVTEVLFLWINEAIFGYGTFAMIIENFLCVAVVEEGFKFLILYVIGWKDRNLNYTFDGVVYSVAVGMGFAIAENIRYVGALGLKATLIRMFTAVPAHAVFAVFMGVFFGVAKKIYSYEPDMRPHLKISPMLAGIVVPVIFHGFYDFIAGGESVAANVLFIILVIGMDWVAYLTLKASSKTDSRIS